MANLTLTGKYLNFLWRIVNLQTFPIAIGYLVMIFLSPVWRKTVRPLKLNLLMVIYNFSCSILSAYTVAQFVMVFVKSKDLFDMNNHESLKLPMFVYWLTKWIELFDTVLMILRHKERQISFLHVYHHCSVLILSDMAYHSYQWPPVGFVLCMNSFVHVFLYMYYGQSALFPGERPWWKRRLTQLQILQFLVGLVHLTYGYFYYGFCLFGPFYALTMFGLFSNFYYFAFISKKSLSKKKVS
ncbi:elongation of very long chain fatty acids protein 4-like isoform X2 [Xenia sp. Carnegie-2017]|uniref:elongation of very long chain fatty acids protein 4-like isoform X2 n=1 Tax=Xenia sp. Carnegie-2017 TaxID=2897299 RepID=UPI001F034AD0|nr:elongation of very long chain fatty acids protein 4-like isoform X2 [Xenia sp. Carnegie-2017]